MKTILIVDNNPVIRKVLSSVLEKENFQVQTAHDGLDALDVLESFIPDIIFLDLIMPNINGEQFTKIIAARNELKHTKIIIISAVAVESSNEYRVEGVHGCIAKSPQLSQHVLELSKKLSNSQYELAGSELIGATGVYPREATKELLQVNRHLQVVLQNMNEGIIELSRDFRVIFANPAVVKLMGLSFDKILAAHFIDFFQGDDQKRVEHILSRSTHSADFLSVSDDDPVALNDKHVAINCIPVSDRENVTLMVIMQDVTKKKLAENKLVETKEYLSSVFNSVQAGIVVFDAEDCTIVDANPRALEMLGLSMAEIVGRNCKEFWCPESMGKCPILQSQRNSFQSTHSLKNNKGATIVIHKTATVCMIDGRRHVVESFFDISEQKNLEKKLHSLAITDELTKLLNRRGFLMMAKKQLDIADRTQGKLFLLFADVDNLKWINDSFGHDIGDQALIKVANILSSFRSSDIIARLGGDEFAILISDPVSTGGELQLRARFNGLLEEENLKNELGFELGVSFGVITYDPQNPCDITNLIAMADQRMYLSKKEKKKI